jgi:hypothetical protein
MAKITNRTQTKRNCIAAALVAMAASSLPVSGSAEVIQVPVGQQAKQKWSMERPITGMKQSQVEAMFGKPLDWREAVGDPPISSWVYPDFVVYFEYDHVIHSVLMHKPQTVE